MGLGIPPSPPLNPILQISIHLAKWNWVNRYRRTMDAFYRSVRFVYLLYSTYPTPAMPHVADDALREYTGYFHSNDEKLNRVWYAGAYTNQLCTIDPSTGNALIHLRKINAGDPVSLPVSWYNNHTICEGTSCLTDGAKRDRLVWAGDMAIAVPAVAVSTKDLISVRNALDSLFALQGAEGNLPYAGTPFNELGINSATYHLYTLIGIHDFYHFTGDLDFLKSYWARWKQAMEFSLKSVDDTGLMYVTIPDDWLRFGMGGHNIEVGFADIALGETN